ncbi:MAG: Fic family protein [Clostridia bacterium]|nr:Fic family protein [Lachnospiraceae bacterium]NCC01740.1 Fic family protein [Clostridia bacterium]NCD03661.1 Fic family protein [Clostridia bacterium]
MNKFVKIQDLLNEKADCQARINLMPYDGSPEIKEQSGHKYLYVRKRVAGRLTSTYVDVYSEELYQLLLRNARDIRVLRKRIRQIEKELSSLGYEESELSERVFQNIDFARANMKSNIYDQAVLEGVGTSFPQTEGIIDNGTVNGVKATDVQKILNLKHAWEFILDKDVIQSKSDFYMVSHIAKLVNEGFYMDGGRVRGIPVTIGGSTYVPPIPRELAVKESIDNILNLDKEPIDIAIEICLYCMKMQIFIDGNKRAAVIFANQYLIAHGQGFIVIPESEVDDFKKLLVKYYEGEESVIIRAFLKEKCWKNF